MRSVRLLVASVLLSTLACVAMIGSSVGTARADTGVTVALTQSGNLVTACATVIQIGQKVCIGIPGTITIPTPTPVDYVRAFLTQSGPLLSVCFDIQEASFGDCVVVPS